MAREKVTHFGYKGGGNEFNVKMRSYLVYKGREEKKEI